MLNKFSGAVIALTGILASTSASATDCRAWSRFDSSEAYLEPLSVPAGDIGEHLSASQWSRGITFTSVMKGDELWVDITSFPGETTAAAAPAAIMQIGRLADDSFKTLVLSDGEKGLFAIDEPDIRAVGCKFIWGRQGGENPVALLRDLYPPMRWYETGAPITTAWNGSLLGDSQLAMRIGTEVLIPKWVMSAVD